ncbi:MJ0042 family finger-like domain-containing protein [Desulfonatronum thiosulfatophilum]|uniref:MJ0042 family finger-like domain-containing protein n=1 Tax=Desulfonatronum thiosulfatophilum TaxID=617002 RepID=A0A1G6A7F5_9BACT|nr:DUF3426 domain-containing protein [Desulfonatronum thiosulfatophilum]SDB04332.1 MJ0042 family finger-like domain-containing protein [Desulfonatronum thiosulfatophilum]
MIVTCPNCDTKYNLDAAVLGTEGAKVRCIRCSHVFFVTPPSDHESEPDQHLDAEFDWLKDIDEPGIGSKKANTGGAASDAQASDISLEIHPSEEPKSRALTLVFVVLGLVIIGLGVFLFARQDGQNIVSSWFGTPPAEEAQAPEVLGPDQVHLISLQNVRQYFVTNEKIGQLFVIEGKARNDFPTPMELFKIEASLFDGEGHVVERKEFLAGNTVSLFQLQILSEQELDAALQARVGILTNNTNLRPGMDVQFMVVFPNPPATVQEYGLKVIEAQHPPQ